MSILITVYITTQNRPQLLERALLSLKEQSYKKFEVIVCNDASDEIHTSDYEKVVKEFQSSFHEFNYIVNEKKQGACVSRNKAIQLAQGEYITGLDDDDYYHRKRLEYFINFIDKDKFSLVCSNVKLLDNNIINKESERLSEGGEVITFNDIKQYNCVGNQIFVKRSVLNAVGGFDPDMPAWQDYDTWFRIIRKFGEGYKLNACTMYLDDGANRERITTSSKAYIGYKKFIEKHKDSLDEKDLISLKYMDMLNRKQNISIINRELVRHTGIFNRVMKYQMTYRFPKLYGIYQKIMK
ncbi:TPA: glycosyltransferase [Klebsiella pneumoniae]|uniref:glycosyltransferase n=1 Tax=Klebsiella pneumoniae TaxID=573 RepID=UPI0020CD6388|nr:glycosyltransferase [Klebsiella pneumoniae]MCQ0875840.1 glycosyltransferase [Klebsiella pneumoniae]